MVNNIILGGIILLVVGILIKLSLTLIAYRRMKKNRKKFMQEYNDSTNDILKKKESIDKYFK